jgi:hypothetical protein
MKVTVVGLKDHEITEWAETLTPWQRKQLAALYRQGRGLWEGTDGGPDHRWRQAGVRTRSRMYGWADARRRPTDGHERIMIVPTSYGFEIVGIRRSTGFLIDPETAELRVPPEVWTPVWTAYCSANSTANFPPTERRARGRIRRRWVGV